MLYALIALACLSFFLGGVICGFLFAIWYEK